MIFGSVCWIWGFQRRCIQCALARPHPKPFHHPPTPWLLTMVTIPWQQPHDKGKKSLSDMQLDRPMGRHLHRQPPPKPPHLTDKRSFFFFTQSFLKSELQWKNATPSTDRYWRPADREGPWAYGRKQGKRKNLSSLLPFNCRPEPQWSLSRARAVPLICDGLRDLVILDDRVLAGDLTSPSVPLSSSAVSVWFLPLQDGSLCSAC